MAFFVGLLIRLEQIRKWELIYTVKIEFQKFSKCRKILEITCYINRVLLHVNNFLLFFTVQHFLAPYLVTYLSQTLSVCNTSTSKCFSWTNL